LKTGPFGIAGSKALKSWRFSKFASKADNPALGEILQISSVRNGSPFLPSAFFPNSQPMRFPAKPRQILKKFVCYGKLSNLPYNTKKRRPWQ